MPEPVEPSEDLGTATTDGQPSDSVDASGAAESPAQAEPAESIPDERLLAAHDLALAALHEITSAETVGAPAGHRVEADGAVSLLFENTMPGYPGWYWTVTSAVVEGSEPTVLEAELLPGDGALLAPEWVPWSVRLKEYQAHQKELAEAEAAAAEVADGSETEAEGSDDDLDDESDDDFDADGSSILHSGDVDGVDIDELDESDDDYESDGDDESDDDDDESDDDDDDDESDDDGEDESDDDE